MEFAGRAYRFGFYVYEEEAKIMAFSNHVNWEKVEKETKLIDKIETVFSIGAVIIFGLSLMTLLLFALYCPAPIFPRIFAKQIALIIFVMCAVLIGFVVYFLVEKGFCRIFDYSRCVFSKSLREYHATEHKVIALLGSGFSPTLENLRGASSFSWGCGMIEGLPRFFWFLERLTLSEPSEEKLIEGIRAIEMYYQKSKEKSLKGGKS